MHSDSCMHACLLSGALCGRAFCGTHAAACSSTSACGGHLCLVEGSCQVLILMQHVMGLLASLFGQTRPSTLSQFSRPRCSVAKLGIVAEARFATLLWVMLQWLLVAAMGMLCFGMRRLDCRFSPQQFLVKLRGICAHLLSMVLLQSLLCSLAALCSGNSPGFAQLGACSGACDYTGCLPHALGHGMQDGRLSSSGTSRSGLLAGGPVVPFCGDAMSVKRRCLLPLAAGAHAKPSQTTLLSRSLVLLWGCLCG